MSGSVSRSKNDPSQSLQMIERPLMTPDELKSMPKGQFVVMKTRFYPMKVKLKLFFKWGIEFDESKPYTVADNGNREVVYAEKKEIVDGIIQKYHPEWLEEMPPEDDTTDGGQSPRQEQEQRPLMKFGGEKKNRSGGMRPVPPSRRQMRIDKPPEVSTDGQA